MTVVERPAHPADALRADDDPPRVVGRSLTAPPPASFVFGIGRVRAAVVVTLHGELTGPAVAQLEDVLEDLICDQGNLTVMVVLRDLSGIDPAALALFSAAAGWARQRGGSFRLV